MRSPMPRSPGRKTASASSLAIITITAVAPDNEEAAKELLFLPGNVTDGVAPSDDPLIAVRDASYAISFSRRSE